MRRRRLEALTVLLVVLAATAASGAVVTRRWGVPPAGAASAAPRAPVPTGYAPKTAAAPTLDGKLDEACWAKAPALDLLRTLDGSARAAQPTEVRVLHDAKNLYVAYRCVEPAMDKIKAARRSHDGAVWGDESVEFFLGFGRTYFHFGVNAAGSTYDGRVKDAAWNSGLKAATARAKGEWTVEVAIPLASMAGKAKVPTRWIANFNRNRRVTGSVQEFAWSSTLSGNSHAPQRFGKLLLADPPPVKPRTAVTKQAVTFLPVADGAGEGVVRFDLSDLPAGTAIYRADLVVFRKVLLTGADDDARKDIEIYPLLADFKAGGTPKASGKALALRGPWFDRFDATKAVRAWRGGKTNGGFFVKVCPQVNLAATCLDVAYAGTPEKVPPQATDVKAFHRAGQTFITFKEIDDPVGTDEIAWGQFRRILGGLDKTRRVRYGVYRAGKPITAASLHQAELIARVAPLSGWNVNGRNVDQPIDHALGHQYSLRWHQWNPFRGAAMNGKWGVDCAMERLVVRDGQKPLPRGTGVYVHTPGRAGKAYYAVVTGIDGVENTKDLGRANVAGPVTEVAGAGEPILQKVFAPQPYFNYREKRYHYIRWVAPPYVNLPSQYYNWAVGVPDKHPKAMPVELSLHRDGRSYRRTQFRVEIDSLVLSPHDFPVKTWWYGYHESLGTLKSFNQGAIRNYTERRLLAFIDWAGSKWPIDRNRIVVVGAGGGAAGGGAIHLGLRHPKVFALAMSGYGAPDYAGEIAALGRVKRAGTMPRQLESIWGRVGWGLKTDAGGSVWDELNGTKIVANLPAATHLPLITVTGRGMAKPTRDFFAAMIEAGQPMMCRFGVYGGGLLLPVSRTGTWSRMTRQDVRGDRIMPVFRDTSAGSLYERPKEPSGNLVVSDGIQWWWGVIGTGWVWDTETIVDEPARLEITMRWAGSSRVRNPHADVTLRRIRKFRIRADWEYSYEVRNLAGEPVEKGKVKPNKAGLLAFDGLPISAKGARLIVTP